MARLSSATSQPKSSVSSAIRISGIVTGCSSRRQYEVPILGRTDPRRDEEKLQSSSAISPCEPS